MDLVFDFEVDADLAAGSTERVGPARRRVGSFEVIETLAQSARTRRLRARRVSGARRGELVRLVVRRSESRAPEDLAALEALRVPGISRLLAHGELEDGSSWYESELPGGPLLSQIVEEMGRLPLERTLLVFSDLLDSLARAHAKGLVHGALDATRVALPPQGRPVLLDFGLTWRDAELEDLPFLGSISPEAWRGRDPDARSDLYAVGALLFYALSGQHPFSAKDPVQVCRHHLHRPAPTLAQVGVRVPPLVEHIVARLLAKEPRDRYGSADHARLAIDQACGRAPLGVRPASAADASEGYDAPSGYRFLRRLGKGANGAVYAAIHETLARPFAIKVMRPGSSADPEVRRRFFREARVASSLDHPGVVKVHDAREEHGRLYLMMELIEGRSLRARLDTEGTLAEDAVRSIAIQVLDVLAAAHDRGIIHRDVKPDNLLMTADGDVKVSDFGIARCLESSGDITKCGIILGTPLYMAPEQCQANPVDARSDLYSLGATLYHLLAGRAPFEDRNILAVMRQHVYERPVPIRARVPGLSPAFAAVIDRLLEKSPEARFASARDVIATLVAPPTVRINRAA